MLFYRGTLMTHYFQNDPTLKSERRLITFTVLGAAFQLVSDAGVFSKDELDEGTRILLESCISLPWQGVVGDIGCAIGTVGLVLATHSPQSRVYLADVNERAIELAKENAERMNLVNVQIAVQDGISTWPHGFDSMWLNPPIRAGKAVIYRLYREAYDHLRVGGSLFIVIRKDHGSESTYKELSRYFSSVRRLNREKGYHVYQAMR